MSERIKALYQDHILKKSRDQTHYGPLAEATHLIQAYNPLCGDQFKIYLKVEHDHILEARFEGYGCAISKASTALFAELLSVLSINDAKELVEKYLKLVDSKSKEAPHSLFEEDRLLAFAAAREFPERKTCAELSWKAVADDLLSKIDV